MRTGQAMATNDPKPNISDIGEFVFTIGASRDFADSVTECPEIN